MSIVDVGNEGYLLDQIDALETEVKRLHADFHWVWNSLLTDSQLDVVHPSTGEYLRFYFGRPPEGELAAPSQELLEEQAALAAEKGDEHE